MDGELAGFGDADGGWFAGRWVDRHLNVKGGLKGEWRHSSRCQGGFFRGVWAANCLQAL